MDTVNPGLSFDCSATVFNCLCQEPGNPFYAALDHPGAAVVGHFGAGKPHKRQFFRRQHTIAGTGRHEFLQIFRNAFLIQEFFHCEPAVTGQQWECL